MYLIGGGAVKMDGPVHANNGNNGAGGNARRGTATEFSYMLQREVIAINFSLLFTWPHDPQKRW